MTLVHISVLVAAILPGLALVIISLMVVLNVWRSLAWNGRAVMRMRLFLTFHVVPTSCRFSGALASLRAWLISFLSFSRFISSSLAAPPLLIIMILCETGDGPIFFLFMWMVFDWSRADGAAGGGGSGGDVGSCDALPLPFASFFSLGVLVLLDGPAGVPVRLLVLVAWLFLFFSMTSMCLPISLRFQLIVSARVVVVGVRVVTCLSSSWLVRTSVLMMPVIFAMSKSSVSVLRLVVLVGLWPLVVGALPDLARPLFRFAVILSMFSRTNPGGSDWRWVSPKSPLRGGITMLRSLFLMYGEYVELDRLCLWVEVLRVSSLIRCSAMTALLSKVVFSSSFLTGGKVSSSMG